MKKASSANCDICGTMDDVQHVLVECSRYNLERLDVMRRYKINRFDVGALTSLLSQPTTEGFSADSDLSQVGRTLACHGRSGPDASVRPSRSQDIAVRCVLARRVSAEPRRH
ncbi:jg18033 [Pararge aegeria aegeria]|uniref:Jg18033 protein n=1 Tax=Pararge aegeria aegeria TaxID=348720 RepID=A0A8S4QGK8_9NEOP|nr:jg18033 [Pararge aegeria aegeria]